MVRVGLGPGSTVKCLLALSLIQQWCVNLVWSAALAFCLSDLSVHTGIATTVWVSTLQMFHVSYRQIALSCQKLNDLEGHFHEGSDAWTSDLLFCYIPVLELHTGRVLKNVWVCCSDDPVDVTCFHLVLVWCLDLEQSLFKCPLCWVCAHFVSVPCDADVQVAHGMDVRWYPCKTSFSMMWFNKSAFELF